MSDEDKIDWPDPPEGPREPMSNPLRQIDARAAELRAAYARARGEPARRRRMAIKIESLELLRMLGARAPLLELFDVMLGVSARHKGEKGQDLKKKPVAEPDKEVLPKPPWVWKMIDFEARENNEGRAVRPKDLGDFVQSFHSGERHHIDKRIREIRNAKPTAMSARDEKDLRSILRRQGPERLNWYETQVLMRRVELLDSGGEE